LILNRSPSKEHVIYQMILFPTGHIWSCSSNRQSFSFLRSSVYVTKHEDPIIYASEYCELKEFNMWGTMLVSINLVIELKLSEYIQLPIL
jgi:hypothetical protein